MLTALLAQIRIPLPFTPVPLTGQTFSVLLSGAILGWQRGFASQLLYLIAGAAGMPVFAGGAAGLPYLLGPSGGYLLSFPVAAGVLGRLVELGASRRSWKLALALLGCNLLILGGGALWLSALFKVTLPQAWRVGVNPFLVGDVAKLILVAVSLPKILNRKGRDETAVQ